MLQLQLSLFLLLSFYLSLTHSILHSFSLFFTDGNDGCKGSKGSNGGSGSSKVKAQLDKIRRASVSLVKAKPPPQPPPPPPIPSKKGGVPMPPPIRQKGVPSTISVLPMAMLPALIPTAAGSRAQAAEERAADGGGGHGGGGRAGSPSGTSSGSDGTANVLGVWTLGLGLLGDSECEVAASSSSSPRPSVLTDCLSVHRRSLHLPECFTGR